MKLFNSALVLLIVVNFVHSEQNNETLEKESHVVGEPTEEELQKRRNEKLAAMPYSHPPPDPEKARLLIYEYDIQTVDHIHNPTEPEESGIKTETKAKYYFELLNHDQNGCILARYQIYECITGDCENVPDIYIYIVQGGQNVLGVWYKPKDENKKINWGLTLSLAYAVTSPAKSGEGDEQIVKTPFGRCRQFFGRPQDKLFTRKMDLCDFESNRNHTLFPGLLNLDYQQFIEYKQNKKIDADIVFVEADEQFLIQTPSQPESAIRIHSHLSAEMMNRTRRYMKRYCPKGMLGSACATEIFGAKHLGKNWLDVNTKLVELSRSEISLTEFVSKKRKEFKKCQNTNDCVELFKNLTNIIRETEPETIVQIVQNFKDEEILNFLLSGVAIVGPTTAWKEVFKHAYKLGRLLAQQFLDNIAFTTVPPTTALKEIHNWEKVNFDVDFYNIIGYLTQKRCLSTPSNLNACNLNKDSFFKNLLKNTDKLTPEQQSKSLWHLNFKSTSDYFSQFLCSGNYNSDLQERSLTFYNKLHSSFFERSINMKLLNIFWNTCPQPVSTVQSVLALNILVRIAPDYPTVGSFLLRSEKINPENHNLWALFYQKVKSSIEHGTHKVRRYWSELRHLKAFRPNYLQRSLKHKSSNFIENYQNLTLPMTVKGTYVANAKEDFEEFNVAFSSHVPILEVKMSKTLQILDIFGLPQILDKKEKNQFLPIRDYSQKIRLLSGNTLDLTLNVIAGLQTKSEKSTVTVKSSILIGTTAELFGSQTNQGSMNSQLLISNEVKIGHEKSCPVIDFENWLAKTATTKTFVEKQEEKVSSRKHTGFSLNLGQSVNSHC